MIGFFKKTQNVVDLNELVAIDTETTGLNPKKDEILSIGAVKIDKNRVILSDTFFKFLVPTKSINKESIKIHQIRPCDIKKAIDPKEAILSLIDFIGSRAIVGYYIKFDMAILNRYIKKYTGKKLSNECVEISSMYYKRKKRGSPYEFIDLKFDTIIDELDIPKLGKHDALNDAVMAAISYLKLKNMPEYKGTFL